MLVRLLYVSRCSAGLSDEDVAAIVQCSRGFNADWDITGSLMKGSAHFAQILEGKEETLNDLMTRIMRDSRHSALHVVTEAAVMERRHRQWSMAYMGASSYVDQIMHDAHQAATKGKSSARSSERLNVLLSNLARVEPRSLR